MKPPARSEKLCISAHEVTALTSTATGTQAGGNASTSNPTSWASAVSDGIASTSAARGMATMAPLAATAASVFLMPWRPMSWAISAGTTYPAATTRGALDSHSHAVSGVVLSRRICRTIDTRTRAVNFTRPYRRTHRVSNLLTNQYAMPATRAVVASTIGCNRKTAM